MTEKYTQDSFAAFCKKQGIPFVRSRMDKRSTIQKGVSDFIVFPGYPVVLLMEFKTITGKLSPDQVKWSDQMANMGYTVKVVRSIEEAIGYLDTNSLPERPRGAAARQKGHPGNGSQGHAGEKKKETIIQNRLYIADSGVGPVVVQKNVQGHWGCLRLASSDDVLRYPKRTTAVI